MFIMPPIQNPLVSRANLFTQDFKLGHSLRIGVTATFRYHDKDRDNSNKETPFLLEF